MAKKAEKKVKVVNVSGLSPEEKKLTPANIGAMEKLKREGKTGAEIHDITGWSEGTISKYVGHIQPDSAPAVSEVEDTESPVTTTSITSPSSTPVVITNSNTNTQPSDGNQSIPETSLIDLIIAMTDARIPREQAASFFDKVKAQLNGGVTQGPRLPRLGYEVTSERPRILENNGGVSNGQEEPHTTVSHAINSSDPLERQFAYAALSRGMPTEEFIERIVLPDLKSWGLVKSAVPGSTNEEVETNLLAMIEDCLTFRRMMKKSRSEVQREKQENVELN